MAWLGTNRLLRAIHNSNFYTNTKWWVRAILTWNSWDTFCVSPNVSARYYQDRLLRAIHQQPFPYKCLKKRFCDSIASQNHSKTEPQSKKLLSEWWCQWLINKIPLRLTFANQVFFMNPPPPPNIPGLKYRRKIGLLLLLLWMVYTELAPWQQHFTWHQPCNNPRALPVHHFCGY